METSKTDYLDFSKIKIFRNEGKIYLFQQKYRWVKCDTE